MYHVYILYSTGFDKFYIGQTSDITTRLEFHNHISETSFTSRYRPWDLAWSLEVPNQKIAMKIERFIKKKKSRSYLEGLVENRIQFEIEEFS
ncbi:MAG: GIY-YIG nuclease family protein [Saprospiraceae bacterium]